MSLWWKLATLCLGLLCLIQFYLLQKRSSSTQSIKSSSALDDNNKQSERQAWQQLQENLQTNNARSIRQHLLQWARVALTDQTVSSLRELVSTSNSIELKEQLNQLDKNIYSNGETFNAQQLASSISDFRKELISRQKNLQSQHDQLAPLYPV